MPIRFRDQRNIREDAGLPIPPRPKSEEGWFEKAGKFLRGLGRAKEPATGLADHEAQPLTSDAPVQEAAERVFGSFQDPTTKVASRSLSSEAPLLADHDALQVYDHGPPLGDGSDIRQTYTSREGEFTERAVRHDAVIQDLVKQNKRFVSSGFFREQISKMGFDKAAENYVAAPVNMRTQSLTKTGKTEPECKFMRMGAITDLRNGFTNLRELKEMKENPSLKDRKLQELRGMLDNPKLNDNQKAAIKYAIKEIENPAEAIENRKAVLKEVFMKMLKEQVNNKRLKEGDQGKEFTLIQLSLLNPEKRHFDRTGWMHDERNAMLDMAEIYGEMNGQIIDLGDGKGPFKLNAVFINVSVQGHTKNDASQYLINQKAADQFRDMGIEPPPDLTGKKSNYDTAEIIGIHALNHGALVINCASGKDRTGAVAARLVLRKMPADLYLKRKDRIFDRDSVAAEIVKDNTNISVLKVDPRQIFTFPGISTSTKARFLFSQVQTFIFSGKPKT